MWIRYICECCVNVMWIRYICESCVNVMWIRYICESCRMVCGSDIYVKVVEWYDETYCLYSLIRSLIFIEPILVLNAGKRFNRSFFLIDFFEVD